MAVAMRSRWFDQDLPLRHRDSWWGQNDWLDDWKDWPKDWPQPRELMGRFWRDTNNWWKDWPTDWPRMDAVMPRMTSHLDQVDRNWRNDPFWMDIYPRWAEPIFKDGIDVQSSIVNDDRRFAVDIDCYQFKPEEIQVKTLDDTLMIEGRHEEVRDRDNFTKMYFVRKYQLPTDVDASRIQSSIDARGHLSVEAPRFHQAIEGRERLIPIESTGRRSAHTSPRSRFDDNDFHSTSRNTPIHVQTNGVDDRSREIRVDTGYDARNALRSDNHSSRSDNYARDYPSPGSRDGYSTQSYSFHRSTSRSRLSPHDVTMSNENRAFSNGASPRRASFDTRDNTTGFRSQSRGATESRMETSERDHQRRQNGYSSDSRNGYRVDSPSSMNSGILRNGTTTQEQPRSESRSESLRSIQILKKTYG